MPRRDPIEGRLVDAGPEPSHYVPQLSRARRFVLWFLRSGAVHWVLAAVCGIAIVVWKRQAVVFLVGLTAGWYLGWYTAKSFIKHDGDLPPL